MRTINVQCPRCENIFHILFAGERVCPGCFVILQVLVSGAARVIGTPEWHPAPQLSLIPLEGGKDR